MGGNFIITKPGGLNVAFTGKGSKNFTAEEGAFLPQHSINSHNDVTIANPADGNVLWYNVTQQKWVNNIAPWLTEATANTLYYPLNSNPSGYLTTVTETDPVYSASPAAGITGPLIANWNTAYNLAHSAVSLGTANGLSLNGQQISLQTANVSQSGALSSGDWAAFNNKQPLIVWGAGLTNAANTVTNDLLTGKAGGQTIRGGTQGGENLMLQSTTHATKGAIFFGATSKYQDSLKTLQIGRTTAHQVGFELYMDNNGVSYGTYPSLSINNPNASGYAQFAMHAGDGVGNMHSRWLMERTSGNMVFGTYTAGKDLNITTNNVTRMQILGSGANPGFIGINKTLPSWRVELQSGGANEPVLLVRQSSTARMLEIRETSGVGAIEFFGLGNAGNVSVGVNGTTYRLQVRAAAANNNIFSFENNTGAKLMEGIESGGALKWSMFGVPAVARQTGGAATAGGAYTATEQTMLNTVYTALRNYGLLT